MSSINRLLVTKEITIVDHAATGAAMRAYRRIHGVPDTAFWSKLGIGPAVLEAMESGDYEDWCEKTVESMKRIIDNYSEREINVSADAQAE